MVKKNVVVFKLISFSLFIFLSFPYSSFGQKKAAALKITATVLPMTYLIEKIGKDLVEVDSIIGKGENPHTFSLSPQEVTKISKSDMIMTFDSSFERVLTKKLASINKEIKTYKIYEEKEEHHHHHHHDHENDPHVWMSVHKVKEISKSIYQILLKEFPREKRYITTNYYRLIKEIEGIKKILTRRLLPYKGKAFLVYHAAYGNLAEEFGLKQMAIQVGESEPSPKHLSEVIKTAKKLKLKGILCQKQFANRSAKIVARAVKAKLIFINPLNKDIISNLDEVSKSIVSSIGPVKESN
jgi:zinc transport system substrate-binding protein